MIINVEIHTFCRHIILLVNLKNSHLNTYFESRLCTINEYYYFMYKNEYKRVEKVIYIHICMCIFKLVRIKYLLTKNIILRVPILIVISLFNYINYYIFLNIFVLFVCVY